MDRSHRHLTARPIDFWLARGAILVIVVLQIGIVNDLAVGPHWLAPGLELALLVPLSAAHGPSDGRVVHRPTPSGPASATTVESCGGWPLS
jgi:hypothetical protein